MYLVTPVSVYYRLHGHTDLLKFYQKQELNT